MDDARMTGIRILWEKCTTFAKCQTIQIALSNIMHDWEGMLLSLKGFWFIKNVFPTFGKDASWYGAKCTLTVRRKDGKMIWSYIDDRRK
jgi:hypothetical protein